MRESQRQRERQTDRQRQTQTGTHRERSMFGIQRRSLTLHKSSVHKQDKPITTIHKILGQSFSTHKISPSRRKWSSFPTRNLFPGPKYRPKSFSFIRLCAVYPQLTRPNPSCWLSEWSTTNPLQAARVDTTSTREGQTRLRAVALVTSYDTSH